MPVMPVMRATPVHHPRATSSSGRRARGTRRGRGLLGAGLLGLALVLVGVGCSSDSGEVATASGRGSTNRTVTATATGSAIGVPDNLQASVGISNRGSSAADVLAENSRLTQGLIDELKKAGIDDKDVATASVNLGPTYNDKGIITGYAADNLLRVTFRDLKTAGAKLDALVKVGGDSARINGITLGFNDDDALLSEARADAVKRAKVHASEMAEAGGAKVGRVRTITEIVGQNVVGFERASAADAVSSVPISAGSQELTVQVKVVFELS